MSDVPEQAAGGNSAGHDTRIHQTAVDPYTIVGRVPAKPIRLRHPAGIAERLMDLSWWDWPHEKLKTALEDFRMLSAEEFLEKHESR